MGGCEFREFVGGDVVILSQVREPPPPTQHRGHAAKYEAKLAVKLNMSSVLGSSVSTSRNFVSGQ